MKNILEKLRMYGLKSFYRSVGMNLSVGLEKFLWLLIVKKMKIWL